MRGVLRMTQKKSLYEILELQQDADYADIRAAYERLQRLLESQQSALSREDYATQLRLLKVAFSTLSAPSSRDAYDAGLHLRTDSARPGSALLVTPAASSSNTAGIRADALMMRAEAMTLRADALGLKADLLTGQLDGPGGAATGPAASRWFKSMKRALLVLGTLAALGMVFKLVFMLVLSPRPVSYTHLTLPTSDLV